MLLAPRNRSLRSLALKGGGSGWGSATGLIERLTPTRPVLRADLPLAGGGIGETAYADHEIER